jgi:hypothetical protein
MENFPMNKAIVVLLVVFVGFWLVTDPHGLAQSAHDAGNQGADWTGEVFSSLITFLREL